jgi:acyl-CoA synthetase (AMP-forming)/AMP-acid ligase II
VKAIVVLENGHSATSDEIIGYCRTRIASYKKPKFVEFADAIPTVNGTTDYDALDAKYGGGGYPGGANVAR